MKRARRRIDRGSDINTRTPIENDGVPRMPHERDETPDRQSINPTEKMKQALKDLNRGLVDTDLRGQRGVENVMDKKDVRK